MLLKINTVAVASGCRCTCRGGSQPSSGAVSGAAAAVVDEQEFVPLFVMMRARCSRSLFFYPPRTIASQKENCTGDFSFS